jgi:stage V sporulation protein D (sporulation-specific penicillin-binding protein)
MRPIERKSKNRIILFFGIFCIVLVGLCVRVGYLQIVNAEELTKKAIVQQTNDEELEAKRGVITDRNGKELAVSSICYSVWARPSAMDKDKLDDYATTLSGILALPKDEVITDLTQDKTLVKLAKYLERDTADAIREAQIPGISITEETKRYYPLGDFASSLLGSVTDDNQGLTGLEQQYNKYLKGVSGRWVLNTDASGNPLSYGEKRYFEPENGATVQLTVDEVIQHYIEQSIDKVMEDTKADGVRCIVMNPKTGEILGMAVTPSFDPNNPRMPLLEEDQKTLASLTGSAQLDFLNKMWRNPLIQDTYEPGSTAKLITTSIVLEEELVAKDELFTCTGSIDVAGRTLHCWRIGEPHGVETLSEALGNSCNPVFAELGGRIGLEKYYRYMETFGITKKTSVDFPGEANSILQDIDSAGPVGLATMAYGQGIAVTPIQLLSAVCSLGNHGMLMQPKLVDKIIAEDGTVIKEYPDVKVRQTVSEATAKEISLMMESVVAEGGGGNAKISGYRVGGKTGTAYKVANGVYTNEVCASFVGMAPMDDPQVAILLIVDNPKGAKYGSITAAPGAKVILENVLRYMNVKPVYTAEEKQTNSSHTTTVPNVIGESYSEAIGILGGSSLKYIVSPIMAEGSDFIIKDQFPKPGEQVAVDEVVYLYRE